MSLDSHLALANTATVKMLPTIIEQALNDVNVFVFGEILAVANVQALKSSADAGAKKSFDTLELFAYGTFSEYQKN